MIGTRPHPERISCGVPAESDPIEPPREGETPGSARESGGFANDRSHVVVELEPLPLS